MEEANLMKLHQN